MTSSLLILTLLLARVDTYMIKEMDDREVAAGAETTIKAKISNEKFLSCVPHESQPYNSSWSEDFKEKIFGRSALKDLRNCNLEKCAFNFLPEEVAEFAKAKSEEETRSLYLRAFQNRVDRKIGLDPERTPHFLRSKSKVFPHCEHDKFSELLDSRPVKNIPFRLAHVEYSARMRQTTRLLQGISFPASDRDGFCYAEALIFSDHYDLDRVEVWKILREGDRSLLVVEVRNRLDFLNTWFRRMNKKNIREELKRVLAKQTQSVADCLIKN